jgi:hypothetical protein
MDMQRILVSKLLGLLLGKMVAASGSLHRAPRMWFMEKRLGLFFYDPNRLPCQRNSGKLTTAALEIPAI